MIAAIPADAPAPAIPAQTVTILDRVERYPIDGRSFGQLNRRMEQVGPQDADGSRRDGYTRWDVRWDYTVESGVDGCHLRNAKVRLSVVITLPEWTGFEVASRSMQQGWQAFLRNLTAHEQGHRQLGVDAATQIQAALDAAAPGACDGFTQRVDANAQRVIAQYQQANVRYDAQTRHGQTQGVQLPPSR